MVGNRSAGISVFSSTVTVEHGVVRETLESGNGQFGDGLSASSKSTLDVQDTAVEHSSRAGIIFFSSGGSVNRSLIRDNTLAIVFEQGSNPFISDDNQMVGNMTNRVVSGQGLNAPSVPPVPNPFGSDAGPDAGVSAQ